jgi:hypothetical protein
VRVGTELLQVKALRRTHACALGNLSPVRSDGGYDAVVVVIFTEVLHVEKAIWIPREVVNEMFKWRPHINGRVIRLSRNLLEHAGVEELMLSDASLDG